MDEERKVDSIVKRTGFRGETYSPLEINLSELRSKTRATFKAMVDIEAAPLPYTKMALGITNSSSTYAPLFQTIIENVDRMVDISPITYLVDLKATSKQSEKVRDILIKGREREISCISQQLQSIDISASPEILTQKFRGKELIELVAGVQGEYLGVLHAIRALEEARLVLARIVPYVSWPKQEALATTLYKGEAGIDPNGHYQLLNDGRHLLLLREPGREKINYILEAKNPCLQMTGQNAYKLVIAAHEAVGHAGFVEMYDPEEMKLVFKEGVEEENELRLIDALAEGYAMFIEEIVKAAALIMDGESATRSMEMLSEKRKKYLQKYRKHPRKRVYSDGGLIIKNLLRQLEINGLSQEEQISRLREFLKQVDIEKVVGVRPSDSSYASCLEDPLNKLPRKREI